MEENLLAMGTGYPGLWIILIPKIGFHLDILKQNSWSFFTSYDGSGFLRFGEIPQAVRFSFNEIAAPLSSIISHCPEKISLKMKKEDAATCL
jgi:hypothetical protein